MEGHSNFPLVSIVIPAHSISESVARSVLSALAQTLTRIEVIVVAKSSAALLKQLLSPIKDPRLKIKTLSSNASFGDLVNEGVRQAQGSWIAFLHEYDEWLPRKLEFQLKKAESVENSYPVLSCRLIVRSKDKELIWPRRIPAKDEDLSHYLFCQKTPFYGEGLIKFSTLLTKKELLTKVPFDGALPQHEDYDWLLRVKTFKGVSIAFVDEIDPLVIWSIEKEAQRPQQGFDLEGTLSWLKSRKHLFTPRAYACFLLTGVSREVRKKDAKTFFKLVREAFRNGRPSIPDFLWCVLIWISPRNLQHQLASFFAHVRGFPVFQKGRIFITLLFSLYVGLVFFGILRHEMWRDELQAWLIARDSTSLVDLFHNIRYEKHPMLWHVGLFALSRVSQDPFVMQVFHLVIASAALLLFLIYAPFSKLQKLLFAFGYFPFYEYAVKSRNYSLGVLFLFVLCALFKNRKQYLLFIAGILFLLCQTHLFGLILATCFGGILIFEGVLNLQMRREYSFKKSVVFASLFIFLAGIFISLLQIVPPQDVLSPLLASKIEPESESFLSAVRAAITKAYLPDASRVKIKPLFDLPAIPGFILAFFLILFSSGIFLRKTFAFFLYLSGTFLILTFCYSFDMDSMRYYGYLFMLWIACFWIIYDFRRRSLEFRKPNLIAKFCEKTGPIFLTSILLVHAIAGLKTSQRDWQYVFSPAKEAAEYIKQKGFDQMLLVGHEAPAVASLTAYLDRKIYYPRSRKFQTFVVWGKGYRWGKINFSEVLNEAERIQKKFQKDVLLIMTNKFEEVPETIVPAKEFTKALAGGDKFYLYRMPREPSLRH